jgi:hypothetical protein
MDDIVKNFEILLSDDNISEQKCQNYLEKHSKLIYVPFLLNHWLHFNAIISKFPLDRSLISDFAYLTKSSNFWYFVLVELEHPQKRLFRTQNGQIIPTAKLTAAVAQIHAWQDFVRKNNSEILRRISPLKKPLTNNPVYFKYLLVIGRREQRVSGQLARDRLSSLGSKDFFICTYDSIISAYQECPIFEKNIIRLKRDKYEFKYLHTEPNGMFAYLTPDDFSMTVSHKKTLIRFGYDINEWEKGELLRLGDRKPFKTDSSLWISKSR